MNRIAAIALIFQISCAGGVAFAGAAVPSLSVLPATDLQLVQVKGTAKSKSSATTTSSPAPAPKPKPVAPRPSLYSGPDYDNVLGLGNYMMGN